MSEQDLIDVIERRYDTLSHRIDRMGLMLVVGQVLLGVAVVVLYLRIVFA